MEPRKRGTPLKRNRIRKEPQDETFDHDNAELIAGPNPLDDCVQSVDTLLDRIHALQKELIKATEETANAATESQELLSKALDNILPITKVTMEKLRKTGKDYSSCMGLYMFYVYCVRKQSTKQILAKSFWVANRINWSEGKVKMIKSILRGLGFIEDIIWRNKKGEQVPFVKINYVPNLKAQIKGKRGYEKDTPSSGIRGYEKETVRKTYPNSRILEVNSGELKESLSKDKDISLGIEKEDKQEPSKKQIPDEYLQYAEAFLVKQKENFPNRVKITPSIIQQSAAALDKLVRIDEFDFQETIKPALNWVAQGTCFWSKQIYSLATLRNKSKNGNIKFINLLNSYDDIKSNSKSSYGNNGFNPETLPADIKIMASLCFTRGIGTKSLTQAGLPNAKWVANKFLEMIHYHSKLRYPSGTGSDIARDRIKRDIGKPNLLFKDYCDYINNDCGFIPDPSTVKFGVTNLFLQYVDTFEQQYAGEDILPKPNWKNDFEEI